MDFALCPDTGPPRLIRYVGQLPPFFGKATRVARLDPENNVLKVDRRVFAGLSSLDRAIVLKTQVEDLGFVTKPGGALKWVDLDKLRIPAE